MRLRKIFIITIVFTIFIWGCAVNTPHVSKEPERPIVPIEPVEPDEPKVPDAIPVEPLKYNSTGSSHLPDYDINNTPISVWFIKEGTNNVGFIVAGHAKKAVCQVASIEIMTLFEEIGENSDSFFSFGIGFDLRPTSNERWSPAYHEKIKQLEKKLGELAQKYPNQVNLRNIDFNTYKKAVNSIKKHSEAVDRSSWDTRVIEYKYLDSPLIVPFQYLESKEIVRLKIPGSYFGILPTDIVRRSVSKILDDAAAELKQMIKQNNKTLKELDVIQAKTFDYYAWTLESNRYVHRRYRIDGYPPAPKGFWVKTVNVSTGEVIGKRDITAREARAMLKDPSVQVDPYARKKLENWIPECDTHEKYVRKKKRNIKRIIADARHELNREKSNIDGLRKKTGNRKRENELLVDAFLRGWPINTSDSTLNTRLRQWYQEKRGYIWGLLLDRVPKARVNHKMAGIFHSDDVFFKVSQEGKDYEITPYKVIGGDFVQVIDKKIGISQYFTPFNFR